MPAARFGLAAGERGALGATPGVAAKALDAGPGPTAFVARTITVYAVPFARPVIGHESPLVVQEAPPGAAVAVYEMTGEPPSLAGAAQVAVIRPSPAVAEASVGALGTSGCTVAAFRRTMRPLL